MLLRLYRRTLGWRHDFDRSGKIGEAIRYMRNQRRALRTFLMDAGVPLDNIACERSLRPVAVGRKNWLFPGSMQAGEAAAVVYTLVRCCQEAEVEPWDYLEDVLVRVATHPASQVDDLVPARWKLLPRR